MDIYLTKADKHDILNSIHGGYMFSEKMDRTQVFYSNHELSDKSDREYWEHASDKEKLQTVTYLRECFYGETATTGRLQRIYTVSKLE
jgi:hypothetical protein